MKNHLNLKSLSIWLIALTCVIGGVVLADKLTPITSSPEATYISLQDIFDKLTTGATTTEKSFTPTLAPAPTMHTLSEIFEAIYDIDVLQTVEPNLIAGNILDTATIFGVAGSASAGGDTGLPKTGQTISYADYDDGYYETGSPASPRFVDNGDGTISDRATGLMWVKQPELIIPGASVIASNQIQVAHGNWATSHAYVIGDLVSSAGGDAAPYYVCIVAHTSGTFATDLAAGKWILTVWTATAAGLTTPKTADWGTAITNSEALEYAGFTDWRLPNIKELISIIDYGTSAPAINGTYFPNTPTSFYWPSTTNAAYTPSVWLVDFLFGWLGNDNDPSTLAYVRPVRGGI